MAYPLWWAEEGRPSEALRWVSILLTDQYFEIANSIQPIPSDAKKSVWVPDGEGGFDEAMIDTIEGEKVRWDSCLKICFHFLLFVAGQRQSRLGGEDVQGEPAHASEPS